MKIIPQLSLFDDNDFEDLGDLERLTAVLGSIPDHKVISKLYSIRGKGRNDWPCTAMWNSFIASFLFNHETVEQLLRELRRNKQLRSICGFAPVRRRQRDGSVRVFYAPSKSAYSKFLKNLEQCSDELQETFGSLVQYMYDNLDGFGQSLMIDGKAIQSYAKKLSGKPGRQGEHDADWCQKTYTVSNPVNGETVTKKLKWFGFRLHLIADATYEMPVSFRVTKASVSEKTEAKGMVDALADSHPDYLKVCREFMADKGYDSGSFLSQLEKHGILPIIDIRNMWKDKEATHQYRDTDLVYNYKGDVFYVKEDGEQIPLQYKGYDKSTDSQRFGFHPEYHDKRIFRIRRDEDPRIFTQVARSSKKWKRLYRKRTGVERINGRIDRDYQFERHTIRGLSKMSMFITVTFIVYLGLAKSKIEAGQTKGLARMYA